MTDKNVICWVDIPVLDLDRAQAFYEAVLAASIQKRAEYGMEFCLLPHEGNNVSGCLAVMADRKPSQDGPLIYLNVEGRLAQAVDIALKLGAKLLKECEQMGPYGSRAIICDTEGNAVALYSEEV